MRLTPQLPRQRRPSKVAEPGVIAGTVRFDHQTKRLVGRLRQGEIALIDHVDLDRVAAEGLVAAGVSAVLNVRASISGRYPNVGPELLVQAGIAVVDSLGDQALQAIRDGDHLTIEADTVRRDGVTVAVGIRQDPQLISAAMTRARQGLSEALEAFAANTMEYLRQERHLLLDGVAVPQVRTNIAGRHCLVVVRGYDSQADLRVLRPYIRQVRPVLIGVDGGADALIEAGYRPHVIIGDMDSVSDAALTCGAEVIVHAYPDGRAPGLARVAGLGVAAITFPAAATSEDIALLLADDQGAELIVAVGTHATLVEFLDKGRAGMASTFLTRLRVGGKLVDAKGVSRIYRQVAAGVRPARVAPSALVALAAALVATTLIRPYLDLAAQWWEGLMVQLQRMLS